jgi:hypothetical protein
MTKHGNRRKYGARLDARPATEQRAGGIFPSRRATANRLARHPDPTVLLPGEAGKKRRREYQKLVDCQSAQTALPAPPARTNFCLSLSNATLLPFIHARAHHDI